MLGTDRLHCIGNLTEVKPDVVTGEWWHHAISFHRSRHRLLVARVKPLAASCGGVALCAAACIRGVAGVHQGLLRPGISAVHDGRGSSASSLSFSAMPARRLSNSGDPDGSGLSAIAARVRSGWSQR